MLPRQKSLVFNGFGLPRGRTSFPCFHYTTPQRCAARRVRSHIDAVSRDMVAESAVMLDEYHRGLRIQQQLLYLHTREQVYIVQRLVPDIHVRLLAKTRRDEHLFRCPALKPAMSRSKCPRVMSSLRRMVLNRLSSMPARGQSCADRRAETSCPAGCMKFSALPRARSRPYGGYFRRL